MDSQELLGRFRVEMTDVEEPFLWADNAIIAYIDKAQKDFCRLTEGLEDGVSPVTQIRVPAGEDLVKLSPQILKVRSVMLVDPDDTSQFPYRRELRMGTPERTAPFAFASGEPHYIVPGYGPHTWRLSGKSRKDMLLQLVVFRLPKTITDKGDSLEIDEHHHEHLLMGMAASAYGRPDPETVDLVKSREFDARFRAYCAQARQEQGRLRKPNGVTSFSW